MRWLDSIRYRRQVDEWVDGCSVLEQRLTEVQKAFDGIYVFDGFRLDHGERLVVVQGVNLLETRSVRVTNSGSVAHHTKNHNTFRTGQSRSELHDELREVDHGSLIVTDQRVIYLGAKTREIRWTNLLQHTVGFGAAEFHAARQKTPLRVTYTRSGGPRFQFMVRAALAAFDNCESDFIDELTNDLVQLRRRSPTAPVGIEPDDRIALVGLPMANQPRVLPAAPSTSSSDELPRLPRGQFIATPLEVVADVARRLGLSTTVVSPPLSGATAPATVTLPTPAGITALGVEVSIFACLPEQLVDLANYSRSTLSFVVTPTAVDGISTLDDDLRSPDLIIVGAAGLEDLRQSRQREGAAVQSLAGSAIREAEGRLRVNTSLRIARALSMQTQVLVVDGIGADDILAEQFCGADELVVVVDELVEEPTELAEEPAAPARLEPAGPITVAGVVVEAPHERIRSYFNEYAGTIGRYDRTAGSYTEVDSRLIASTRVLRSRITHEEATWFIERAATAPWHLVPEGAQLADADPCKAGDLYDGGSALYAHFRADAPKGIKAAKIYKVLHLMRPGFFPILDTRLSRLYDAPARAIAPAVNACRPDLPAAKYAYWAAIRLDLLAAAEEIGVIRRSFKTSGDAFLASAIDAISDLRLLDMLAWREGDVPDE